MTDVAAQIRLARAAMGNIRQNISVALGLKAVFLVTSVLGLTGLWIAILAAVLVVAAVVWIGRLRAVMGQARQVKLSPARVALVPAEGCPS